MLTSASKLIAEPRAHSEDHRHAISRAIFFRLTAACDLGASFLTCTAVLFTTQALELHFAHSTAYSPHKALGVSLFIAAVATALLRRDRTRLTALAINPIRETAMDIRATLQALALLFAARWLLHAELPYAAILLALLLTPAALMLQRRFFALVLRKLSYGMEAPTAHLPYAWGKRIVDLLVSAFLLVLLSPLFVFIALLIRLTSRGPALFVQKRVGRDGHIFRMYKFRSMSCQAARYERSPKTPQDPRITTVGRILRRTSLDEMPQIINVLLGEMSLVGPRPEMPFIVRHYNEHQRKRLQVLPGITGLWQLSGDRPYPIHENLHHDLLYIRHRRLTLDLAILLHTLFFALWGGI